MSRINTNISAMLATRYLVNNQADLTKSLERLSSGLRINRGADDPAGLIASESLRTEMQGISAAIDNSARAVNVISTADAALAEVSDMLLQIKGLINRSSNSGALSDEELQANQLQVDSLLESINRVANSTQFNGKKLLNGELGYTVDGLDTTKVGRLLAFGARVPAGSTQSVTVQVTQSALTAQLTIGKGGGVGISSSGYLSQGNAVTLEVRGTLGTEIFTFTGSTTMATIAGTITNSKTLTGVSATASTNGISFNSTQYGSNEFVSVRAVSGTFTVNPGDQGDYEDRGRDAGVLVNGQAATVEGLIAKIRTNGLDLEAELTTSFGTARGSETFDITGGGANFQIGPQVNSDGLVSIGVPSINTSNLGNSIHGYLNTLGSGGDHEIVDPANHPTAEKIIAEAISQVAVLSGRLGGFQANQVETNLNSLRTALENVTASESTIRDTDYAAEVSNLTRAQIVMQSTVQMLSIANQAPQVVLSLLR
jgi:flagellin